RSDRDWSSDVCSSDLDRQTATSRRNSISHKTSTRRSRSYAAWLNKKRNDAFHSALINGVFVRKMFEHQIFFAFEFQPETYEHERSEERRVGKDGRCQW